MVWYVCEWRTCRTLCSWKVHSTQMHASHGSQKNRTTSPACALHSTSFSTSTSNRLCACVTRVFRCSSTHFRHIILLQVTKCTCRLFENMQLNSNCVYYYSRKQKICQMLPKSHVHMSSVDFCMANIVKSCYNINHRDVIQTTKNFACEQPITVRVTYLHSTHLLTASLAALATVGWQISHWVVNGRRRLTTSPRLATRKLSGRRRTPPLGTSVFFRQMEQVMGRG